MPQRTLKEFADAYKVFTSTMTKEEFINAFKEVIAVVVAMKKQNEEEMRRMEAMHEEMTSKMKEGNSGEMSSIKKEMRGTMDKMMAEHERGMEKMYAEHEKMVKEQQNGMEFIYDKVRTMKSGKDGESADEEKIVGEVLKKLPEEKPEEIRNKLESIKEENEKLQIEAIKNLRKELDELKKSGGKASFIGGGVMGRDLVKDINISSQLNGVLKTFNIQAVWNIVSVSLSSYPYGSLRKDIDYTWTPTSITFTDEIAASTQLSAGQKCILTVVLG